LLRNRSADSFFSTFYIRRICRIIPIYYLTIALTLFLLHNNFLTGNAWANHTLPIATYFSFTQNIYMSYVKLVDTPWLLPTWTLAVEEQFYLILPLIIWFISEKLLLRVVVALILFAPLLRTLLVIFGNTYLVSVLTLLPCRWDLLFFGVLAAIIQRNEYLGAPLFSRNAMPLKVIALTSVSVLFLLLYTDEHYGIPFRNTIGMIPLGLCFASYILMITSGSGEGDFLKSGFLRFFGTISYALYLIHQPISGFLHGYLLGKSPDISSIPQILVTLLALVVSIFIAWISWRVFESRLVAFGHRWQYNSVAANDAFALKPPLKACRQP
jgi:peptidoglycan/LPS O-acetylase OafA/YrhL